MKLTLLTNSDIGKPGLIGVRPYYVVKKAIENNTPISIICRKNYDSTIKEYVKELGIFQKYFNLFCVGVNRFISDKIPLGKYKNVLFDMLAERKISTSDIIHVWDDTPNTLEYAKTKFNPIIIRDIPIYSENFKVKPYFDYYIAPSQYIYEQLLKKNISKNRIKIIPFGVDLKKYKPNVSLKSETFRVLFVGMIAQRKGVLTLLKAWSKLNLTDSELVLCGHIHINVKDEVNKYLKQDQSIIYRGNLNEEDLIQEYQKATIFILPSTREGSAKVVYEAMACGLPIITTKNAGSIITDNKEGYIIPTNDYQSIVRTLKNLYNNENIVNAMSAQSIATIQKYSWDNYANNVYTYYKKILKSTSHK